MKILLICQLPKTVFMKPFSERYLLSRAQRNLIDEIRIEDVAGVEGAAGPLPALRRSLGPAGNILWSKRIAVAASIGTVVDAVGPGVIGRNQQTGSEGTLQRERQRIVRAVAGIASPWDLRKRGVRTQSGKRVDDIYIG